MISLRKVLFSVFGAVAALLAIVVILGLLQYRFTREYDSIIYQGEKILFRFHSLREHLTRIMIVGTAIDAEAVSGKVDAQGNVKDIDKAMLSDSVATVAGSMLGTSNVTSYIESGSGVKAGGKTGMTSIVIGVCFLLCLFFAPLATSLPKEIDGAALVYVSFLFVRNIVDIEWDDISESGPAVLAMIAMPLTYSISNGMALAFISYALIKIFSGKMSNVSPAIWLIAILGFISFAI